MQRTRDGQRLELGRSGNTDRAICAHRQSRAQLLLRLGGADRNEQNLGEGAGFLETQGGLDRNLVERIDAHLEPFRRHAGAVGFDAHAHVVVNDALDTDHDRLQEAAPRRKSRGDSSNSGASEP